MSSMTDDDVADVPEVVADAKAGGGASAVR